MAEQAAAEARKARQEAVDREVLVLKGMFAVIKKGRKELESDIKQAADAADKGEGDDGKKGWDDLRRMSRLYDTAIRKDGMGPLIGRMEKLKIKVEKKPLEELNKEVNQALQAIDK